MFEAKLVIEIPGLEALAAALRDHVSATATDVLAQRRAEYGVTPTGQTPQAAPVNPTPAATYSPQAPMPNTAPTAPVAPAPVTGYTPGPAPTAPAPSFTAEQVGTAGADLIRDNPAKLNELLALLQQFGVQAISELTPDKLGPFATALRGLGAKI